MFQQQLTKQSHACTDVTRTVTQYLLVKKTLSGSNFHRYFIDKYIISNIQQ